MAGSARVPGSKSYTNRALVIAGLAEGSTRVSNGMVGEDSASMIAGLRSFGVGVKEEERDARSAVWRIDGNGGVLPPDPISIDANLAGTTLRFLTALAALCHGEITISGQAPLRRRPIGGLLAALRDVGADVRGSGTNRGHAPVFAGPRKRQLGGRVDVEVSESSQYASALLLVAPYFDHDLVLRYGGGGADGYIDMTVELMARHGAEVETTGNALRVRAGQRYEPGNEQVPPDASSACHLFTLAIATRGEVIVEGMTAARSQPDFSILEVFEHIGARVSYRADGAVAVAAGELEPFDVDLTHTPDQLPNLAVLAALAPGTSTIRGVGITRFHETNRMEAVASELTKLGIDVELGENDLRVRGGNPTGNVTLWAHDDHRMAMALAALAAAIGDCELAGADAVAKTYPTFWTDTAGLGLNWMPSPDSPGETP